MCNCTCVKLYLDFGLCYSKSIWLRLLRTLYFSKPAAQHLPVLCSCAVPASELCKVSTGDGSKPQCITEGLNLEGLSSLRYVIYQVNYVTRAIFETFTIYFEAEYSNLFSNHYSKQWNNYKNQKTKWSVEYMLHIHPCTENRLRKVSSQHCK